MKKSFKKLGFVSLATSSVLLGSMNATDLETYAALQKPSHVFGNYAAKTNNNKKSVLKDGKESGNSGDQVSQQQQAQNTASSDSTQASTAENIATTDNTTATTDETYTNNTDTTVANAAKQVETDNTAVQKAEQEASQTLQKAENTLKTDQQTLETALQDQKKAPNPTTPPAKEEPSSSGSGSSVASQLVKDAATVNNFKSVSVSGMNTTLSGVEKPCLNKPQRLALFWIAVPI